MTHELKILPKYFDAVNCGLKNFEIRINDRNYQEDDELILKEWERGKYTGRECRRWVGYIYHGDGTYGIAENTVVMALKRSAPQTDCKDCKYMWWNSDAKRYECMVERCRYEDEPQTERSE
jgi:hypothetical protein